MADAQNPRSEKTDSAESRKQDSEVFLRLLSNNRHQLFAFVFTLVPNHTDAEDVFQETSIVLWNKFQHFDQERAFLPWACGVAFNTARNFLRSTGRDRLVFSDSLLATIAAERGQSLERDQDRMAVLDSCLEKLNTEERLLIADVYSGEQTIKEIAVQLNRATQTIYNRLTIIRRKLVECTRIALNSPST